MQKPLVSVICISHNHESFLEEAVLSVINQTYEHIELILVDDGSNDHSPRIIRDVVKKYPRLIPVLLPTNIGNCKAFNTGLKKAKGDFLIDLAADDLLLPDRIRKGIDCFNKKGDAYGVNFTDAEYISASGHTIAYHYKRDKQGHLMEEVPEGSIYKELLERYFICTPSMMIRRKVFEQLGGYDERLSYEDFDFWIRSGKITNYCYTDKILVKKRVLKGSLSSRQYKKESKMLQSTYLVCLKAEKINQSEAEIKALVLRAQFEFRKALFSGNFKVAMNFSTLLLRNTQSGIKKIIFTIIHKTLRILTGY
jgi:glycosyltransferase involved in cell wall biosynthesis